MEKDLEWKNQKEIRKYLANKKDKDHNKEFVIRIRKNKEDLLYYKGIKILEISSTSLKVSDDVVQFNKASIMNAIADAKENEEKVKNKILGNIKEMRQEMFDAGLININKKDCSIKIERKYNENLSNLEHEGLRKILIYLNNCQNISTDIEYVKEYKLKHRDELSDDKNEELDETLFKIANKRKDILNHDLRDNNIDVKLNIDKKYQQNQWVLKEERLKRYSQEVQKERERNWNKEYIISYTLSSSEQWEIKETIQNILCNDKNFEDNNKIKANEEYFEVNDYIIYHLKFNSSNEESITEAQSNALADIEYEIIRNRIFDENLEYHKISEPTFSTIIGKSQPINKLNNLTDIDNITNKMKNKVKQYIVNVKEEVEKHYQFQFMIQDETKLKIQKANKKSKNQIIYPFEQEHFILNRKGRIDAIFFGIKDDTADLYLIELKVNESVIGGSNGVHKHLSDIHELLSKEKTKNDFLESLRKYLNYRRCALDEESNEDKIKEIDRIYFWTIVGYTDDNHKEASKKLLNFYYNHILSDKTKEQLQNLKNNDNLFKNKKIDISIPKSSKSLKEYIEKLNSIGIEVKFFLDSIVSTEASKYSIGEDDFEQVEFKSN